MFPIKFRYLYADSNRKPHHSDFNITVINTFNFNLKEKSKKTIAPIKKY